MQCWGSSSLSHYISFCTMNRLVFFSDCTISGKYCWKAVNCLVYHLQKKLLNCFHSLHVTCDERGSCGILKSFHSAQCNTVECSCDLQWCYWSVFDLGLISISFFFFAELQGEPGVTGPAGREGPPGKDVSATFCAKTNVLLPDK